MRLPADARARFIKTYCDAATPRAAARVVRESSEFMRVSVGALYHVLRRAGVPAKRRHNSGGRKPNPAVTDAQIDKISRIILQSRRRTGKILLSYKDAIAVAEDAAIVPRGILTPPALRGRLKKLTLTKRSLLQPAPTLPRRSDYPNQLQQFDWSVCIQWDFGDRGRPLQFVNWRAAADPNKSIEIAKRRLTHVWRALVVDHYSGAFFLKYYQIPGESAEHTIRFLEDAWFPHDDQPGLVFHGLPKFLMCDQGPGNKSAYLKNLTEAFGVKLRFHSPGRPWAKGAVETLHNIIEKKFEGRAVRFDPPHSIKELNRRALDWQIQFQAESIHSRHTLTRSALFARDVAGYLNIPESLEKFRAAAVGAEETRRLDVNRILQWRGRSYLAPEALRHLAGNASLKIRPNILTPGELLISETGAEWFTAKLLRLNAAGFRLDARSVEDTHPAAADAPENARRAAESTPLVRAVMPLLGDARRRAIAAEFPLPPAAVVQPRESMDPLLNPLEARARVIAAVPGLTADLKRQLLDDVGAAPIATARLRELIQIYQSLADAAAPGEILSAG